MIRSFADEETEQFFYSGKTRRFNSITSVRTRKLRLLENTRLVSDLAEPLGNHLEALKGDRLGQYSIRINNQYRLCFSWQQGEPHDVEITDYH